MTHGAAAIGWPEAEENFTAYTKINSKCVMNINVNMRNCKAFREKKEKEYLQDPGLGKEFLDLMQKCNI